MDNEKVSNDSMESFTKFLHSMLIDMYIPRQNQLTIEEIKLIITKINEYFYTFHDNIGNTIALDSEFKYFSEFHKFWEQNHKQILNPQIDAKKCELIADILHDIFIKTDDRAFHEMYDTQNLKSQEICKIRYFCSIQEFRGTRDFDEAVRYYRKDPNIFDTKNIFENPEGFLKNIGITKLSQTDKRVNYAKTAAKMILEKGIEPYGLFEYFNKNVIAIRDFLLSQRGSGFGKKKADMFIRDMVVLHVWEEPINFDKIDVASDINTVKVSLRTGLLKTDIPLLSSFLDVFCYQYMLIDEMNALAWRSVWSKWKEKYPNEVIESPCLIDYFVYRVIGKEFCKERLYIFECDSHDHQFKWHSSNNKTCQICKKKGIKNKAYIVKKILPCMDEEGYLAFKNSPSVYGFDAILPGTKECPFSSACNPKSSQFKKLNPPKSISILGQTGWDSARTKSSEGGGGLMS